jgi:hypothetical protein
MFYGTLIGDLFDAVERVDNSVNTQRTEKENSQPVPFSLPDIQRYEAECLPAQRSQTLPAKENSITRIIPADVWFERG